MLCAIVQAPFPSGPVPSGTGLNSHAGSTTLKDRSAERPGASHHEPWSSEITVDVEVSLERPAGPLQHQSKQAGPELLRRAAVLSTLR